MEAVQEVNILRQTVWECLRYILEEYLPLSLMEQIRHDIDMEILGLPSDARPPAWRQLRLED
jgi:hypothetical protein